MTADFKFLMISAMYENGGNTTQRFLDGHPQLRVYPFESQLGTRLVSDWIGHGDRIAGQRPPRQIQALGQQGASADEQHPPAFVGRSGEARPGGIVDAGRIG